MNYYKKDIRHLRGDTYSLGLIVEDEVLDTVYFTCRDGLNDNSPVLFQKSLDNGISITETEVKDETTLYKYAIRVDPLDTQDINSGTYYYDLQTELNGDIFTIMKGRFIVEQDVTRNEEVTNEIVVKINEINGEVVGLSALDKLDYLEDTKDLIKDALNDLGEEVADDDTFRSYAEVISGLYDYMEKVTGEGTDVTLNNTKAGLMKLTLKGNTSQETTEGYNLLPTPNPDYPQDIKIVTGDNTITISNEEDTETQTQLISLGNMELCKIGTYQDYIYKSDDKWYKKEYIGKHTIASTDVVAKGSTGTNAYYLSTSIQTPNDNTIILVISNMFKGVSYNNRADGNYNTYSQSAYVNLRTGNNTTIDWSTIDKAKEWVTANTPLIYYILATSTDTEITDTTLIAQLENLQTILKSYEDETNITSTCEEGNAQMIISATALKKGSE